MADEGCRGVAREYYGRKSYDGYIVPLNSTKK